MGGKQALFRPARAVACAWTISGPTPETREYRWRRTMRKGPNLGRSNQKRLTAAAVFALAGAAHGQFSENFDTTTAGSLPAGWSTSTAGAGAPWGVATTQANSVPNSVFTDDVATVSQQFLFMPTITAAGPVTIDLWSYFSTESTFDGWVVEASINGGAY